MACGTWEIDRMEKLVPTIRVAIYGESFLRESMVIEGGSDEVSLPIVFALFHVRIGERQLLIDAGCDTMPGFDMRSFISPPIALEKLGVRADDITDVIVTHAHHDHIDGLRHFKNAQLYIQRDEYELGRSYIPEGMCVRTFDEVCNVCGITVERVGGHTVGSCIAKLTKQGRSYVFCGDECYLRMCLERHIPTGASYSPERSRRFVETYGDARYRTILSHDPELRDGEII